MEDNNLEALAACSGRLKDMIQQCPGWKDVLTIIAEERQGAFAAWSSLDLKAPPEQVLAIRAKEAELKNFLERVHTKIKEGEEAAALIEERKTSGQRDAAESLAIGATDDDELQRLRQPLIFPDNPPQGTGMQ